MDLATITIDDFKSQFTRDFPFLLSYDATVTYYIGDKVYYPTTRAFYKSRADGTINIAPTDGNKWEKIIAPPDSVSNYVQDSDITRAFAEAKMNFNQAFFCDDESIKLAYLYLTAHYLVLDLRNAMAGVSGTGENTVQSRTVGSVSEAYAIPEYVLKDPVLAYYAKTGYGQKYLSFVLPNLVGNVVAVHGATLP